MAKHPLIVLQICIDDVMAPCWHRYTRVVLEAVGQVAKDLVELLEDDMMCTSHTGEAEAVVSSGALLEQLRRTLEPLQGQWSDHAINLGASVASGLRRDSFWKKTVQMHRHSMCMKRAQRIGRVRRATSSKTMKLMKAGAAPGLLYGAQLYGLSDAEDLCLERMAAAIHSGSGKGKSLCRTTALFDENLEGHSSPLTAMDHGNLEFCQLLRSDQHQTPHLAKVENYLADLHALHPHQVGSSQGDDWGRAALHQETWTVLAFSCLVDHRPEAPAQVHRPLILAAG